MGTTSGATGGASSLFTGTSQFSSDLQNAITREVSLASLPLQQMQNDLTTLQSQSAEVTTLATDFTNLQAAISQVAAAIGPNAYSASVSNSSVASVALSGTPQAGSFSITVGSMGSYSSAMSDDSLPTVSDPTTGDISDATSFTLQVGTATWIITPAADTLSALADAINQTGAAKVQAITVNIGSPSAPDYRLALQVNQLGDLPVQLTANNGSDPGQTLLTQQVTGSSATYQVNGQPSPPSAPISTNSPTVTIMPGVNVTLQGTGTTTVSVGQSTSALSAAFSNLATAYNQAMTDINSNRGTAGGPLQGQSILSELSDALNSIADYTSGNSGISSLQSLVFSFDQNGVLSFDSSAFASATAGGLTQLTNFLGSTTSGGFLEAATNTLNSLTAPNTGILQTSLASYQSEITQENQDISNEQDQINTLQTNLTAQMSAADASIASLEQETLYLNGLFSQEQTDQQATSLG
jgi:flagellar hook-associated protein 2